MVADSAQQSGSRSDKPEKKVFAEIQLSMKQRLPRLCLLYEIFNKPRNPSLEEHNPDCQVSLDGQCQDPERVENQSRI